MFRTRSSSFFSLVSRFSKQYFNKKLVNHNLCLVTDSNHINKSGRSLENIVSLAIEGGCTMIQYREKKLDYPAQKSQALTLQKICKDKNVPFIINDNVQLACDIQADGVHIGQGDMEAIQARKLIGEKALLGITVHNAEEVKKAIVDGADYLGTGAIYKSITKPAIPLGLDVLKELVKTSSIPLIAIGGIEEKNSRKILEYGASGLAVSSNILLAEDISMESRKLSNQVCLYHGEQLKKKIGASLKNIRAKKPLVFHITNNVVMNLSANITLSIGASPIMALERREMEEIVKISDALLLNIGTLREDILDSMLVAGRCANALNKPIILDPVGVGASKFRYDSVCKLLEQLKISVIKGNPSEIETLYKTNNGKQQRGVDGEESVENPEKMVRELAERKNTVVAMTGYHDYVSDGKSVIILRNNCEYLPKITGSGCVAGSLIGAFAGVQKDFLIAACGGITSITCAAEMIEKEKEVKGPASFQMALLDQIHFLDELSINRQMELIKVR